MNPDFKAAHLAGEFVHDTPIVTCRFDPTGRFVFATAEDRNILRWELADAKKKVVFAGHDSWIWSMAFSKDGQSLITAGGDDTLIWWPATSEKPEPIRKVTAHRGWVRAVAVSPDGQFVASGGNDRVLKLWQFGDGKAVREFPAHELDIYSVVFHPGGQFVLSGDLKGAVNQWDVATGKLVRTFDAKPLHHYDGGQQVHFGGVRGIALSPDGKQLACAGLHKATNPLGNVHEPHALRFEWDSAKMVKAHTANDLKNAVVWRALFLSDGTLCCVSGGGSGGHLLFWNATDEKPAHQFKLPEMSREMDLHPDGIQVITAHYSRKVILTKLAPKPAEKPPEKKA
jgi:WD40 repeat protein